jgi:hypothetical protein
MNAQQNSNDVAQGEQKSQSSPIVEKVKVSNVEIINNDICSQRMIMEGE